MVLSLYLRKEGCFFPPACLCTWSKGIKACYRFLMWWSIFSVNKKVQPAHNFRTLGRLINESKGMSGCSPSLSLLIHLKL